MSSLWVAEAEPCPKIPLGESEMDGPVVHSPEGAAEALGALSSLSRSYSENSSTLQDSPDPLLSPNSIAVLALQGSDPPLSHTPPTRKEACGRGKDRGVRSPSPQQSLCARPIPARQPQSLVPT